MTGPPAGSQPQQRDVPAVLKRGCVLVPGLTIAVMVAFATAGEHVSGVPAILVWPMDSFVGWDFHVLAVALLLAIVAHPIHPRWWTALLTLAGCALWSGVGFLVYAAHC